MAHKPTKSAFSLHPFKSFSHKNIRHFNWFLIISLHLRIISLFIFSPFLFLQTNGNLCHPPFFMPMSSSSFANCLWKRDAQIILIFHSLGGSQRATDTRVGHHIVDEADVQIGYFRQWGSRQFPGGIGGPILGLWGREGADWTKSREWAKSQVAYQSQQQWILSSSAFWQEFAKERTGKKPLKPEQKPPHFQFNTAATMVSVKRRNRTNTTKWIFERKIERICEWEERGGCKGQEAINELQKLKG